MPGERLIAGSPSIGASAAKLESRPVIVGWRYALPEIGAAASDVKGTRAMEYAARGFQKVQPSTPLCDPNKEGRFSC
jgi:hypothetical protein